MPLCSRCHQPVDAEAITCPHCNFQLKAFGHPGIPLYRATEDESLCDTCLYHADDSCNFPQRPHAQTCTLYHNVAEPLIPPETFKRRPQGLELVQGWFQRYTLAWVLCALVIISVLLSLL